MQQARQPFGMMHSHLSPQLIRAYQDLVLTLRLSHCSQAKAEICMWWHLQILLCLISAGMSAVCIRQGDHTTPCSSCAGMVSITGQTTACWQASAEEQSLLVSGCLIPLAQQHCTIPLATSAALDHSRSHTPAPGEEIGTTATNRK